ncbi:twin-arginine translocase subunit TatC [Flavobacterium sp.]|uniref:twin-arginine translocase subunit TatC n=1 Tax=Flavobacterium sp. TaxID=239 RepID=UPI00248786D3|nr:twin-arginine translocase subunit TatC [Flavobacterium sp.]MDI1318490.1 twin-arginine translocase subunit TatC [Flavobacterium sp.]
MAKKERKPIGEMSFLDHLEELRWLLVRSTIAIIVIAGACYFIDDYIFDTIIFGPKDPNFITYRFFCELTHYFGIQDSYACVTEFKFIIQNTEVGGQFSIYLWMLITFGFILGFPYILWEVWRFISPALYKKERENAAYFIIISSLLFFIGVLFGYFIVIPLSINFFGTFNVSNTIVNQFTIDSYIGMIKTSLIASGLVFEMPIIIYFLTKLGLVTPEFLRKHRRIAVVIILVVAAIVTPPDIPSQVIVSIPMLILYEVSIIISAVVIKKQKENEQIS